MNLNVQEHFALDPEFLKVTSLSESFVSPLSELIRFSSFGAVISPYEKSKPERTVRNVLRDVNYQAFVSEEQYENALLRGIILYDEVKRYALVEPVISIPIIIDEVSPENASFAFKLAEFTFSLGFMQNFVRDASELRQLRGRENIVALCFQQLFNALEEFKLEERTPENYVNGIKHITEGINILAATIRDPSKVVIYDA